MAGIAIDTIIVTGLQAGTVGRGRTTRIPARCTVATDTEIARSVEILLSNGNRRPEDRVASGIAHSGTAPTGGRLVFGLQVVITGVAVIATIRGLEIPGLLGLCTRLLDLRWYNFGSLNCKRKECCHRDDNDASGQHALSPELIAWGALSTRRRATRARRFPVRISDYS